MILKVKAGVILILLIVNKSIEKTRITNVNTVYLIIPNSLCIFSWQKRSSTLAWKHVA